MSLKDQIKADMKEAMKAKDTFRLETIRMLRAAIQRKEVDERVELDDDGVTAVIEKQIKQSQDAFEQFTAGKRDDLAQKEAAGIEILKTYMPEPLSESEVDQLIQTAINEVEAQTIKDMGKVMGKLKPQLQGRADMAQVSAKIKSILG